MYTSKHKNNTNHWIEFSENPHRRRTVSRLLCVRGGFLIQYVPTYGLYIIEKSQTESGRKHDRRM